MISLQAWKNKENFGQFIRYALVAIAAFAVDFYLLFFFTQYLHIFYMLSATFSFLLSSIVSYKLSTKWVFGGRSKFPIIAELTIFTIITLISLGLNDLLLWFITEKLRVFYLLSKIIVSLLVFFWSFFSRRYLFTVYEKNRITNF
jgi:putative flippase GtrA